MKFDVIILAGGLGTRLASIVSDVPKPMATVAGEPFLNHILKRLPLNHIGQIILAVGHKYEVIEDYYGDSYQGITIVYSIEKEPLGTGGGIGLALDKVKEDSVVILNGDTSFKINYEEMWQSFKEEKFLMTIALKQMVKPDRYGTVLLDGTEVVKFQEKTTGLKSGLINGGIYWTKKELMNELPKLRKFSFEEKVLERIVSEGKIGGYISNEEFIDIGIPEDYERAQKIFAD